MKRPTDHPLVVFDPGAGFDDNRCGHSERRSAANSAYRGGSAPLYNNVSSGARHGRPGGRPGSKRWVYVGASDIARAKIPVQDIVFIGARFVHGVGMGSAEPFQHQALQCRGDARMLLDDIVELAGIILEVV